MLRVSELLKASGLSGEYVSSIMPNIFGISLCRISYPLDKNSASPCVKEALTEKRFERFPVTPDLKAASDKSLAPKAVIATRLIGLKSPTLPSSSTAAISKPDSFANLPS